ncbi:TPA: hypothetical protein H1016_03770 [archaeon]|uniref:Uncharacterized protein n=1 Tax=Candidatus Naiadarchaeum limnaeum TaxID=2756139 RepID=A0A832USB4_9ARCH|nr:hypothetical protein [Candidatus Naiadarchaeum limnaeum]
MKISLAILKFLFIGALFLVSNYNLHMNVAEERGQFFDMYTSWLGKIFDQAAEITAYVTSSSWLPGNLTNLSADSN